MISNHSLWQVTLSLRIQALTCPPPSIHLSLQSLPVLSHATQLGINCPTSVPKSLFGPKSQQESLSPLSFLTDGAQVDPWPAPVGPWCPARFPLVHLFTCLLGALGSHSGDLECCIVLSPPERLSPALLSRALGIILRIAEKVNTEQSPT